MSFVRDQLREGESVVFETHLHKIIYGWPSIFVLFGVVLFVGSIGTGTGAESVALAFLAVGLVWMLATFIRHKTSEFAVTDRRVLIKTGLISRRTMETNLAKIEGINVDQNIPGRLLDYGTIVVRGTGGGSEPFRTIAQPLILRRTVQEQGEEIATPAAMTPLPAGGVGKAQRSCPWCAETILAEARICRYCQREVAPDPAS